MKFMQSELYDAKKFTKNIENAFSDMCENYEYSS